MGTQQVVSTSEGVSLVEGCPLDPVREELKSERVQQLFPGEGMRISLKSERVQPPLGEDATGSPAMVAYELTVNQPQPVAIELLEPQIVIALLGNSGWDSSGKAG